MNFVLGVLVGIALLYGFQTLRDRIWSKKMRKGLFTAGLTDGTDRFTVSYEIEEVSRSNKKSKIKVINYHCDRPKYNGSQWKDDVIKSYNNSWVESSKIEWIKYEFDIVDPNDPNVIRDKKIKQILK